MNRIPYVQGTCPACGSQALILGEGGYVTCSLLDCPDPEAATKILKRKDRGMPVLGQSVHYVSHGTPVRREDGGQAYPSVCRAAVITEVEQDWDPATRTAVASLCVLNPTGQFFSQHLLYNSDAAAMAPGTWHLREDHYA